jgi:hypothetical protein
MSALPVTRVTSNRDAPHRPSPSDSRIVADYGLHVTASGPRSYETEWATLVSLHIDGNKIAQMWTFTHIDDPAVDSAIAVLDTWRQVLAGLDELERQEHALSTEESELGADEVLKPGGLPERHSDLSDARARIRTLRAVTVERASALGDRSPLANVEILNFDPRFPAGNARRELARHDLTGWRERQSDRDQVVAEALAAGLSKSDVQRLSGIARTSKPLRTG